MRWFRSTLLSERPTTISHQFMCPNCSNVSKIKAIAVREKTGSEPPEKLSAPNVLRIIRRNYQRPALVPRPRLTEIDKGVA